MAEEGEAEARQFVENSLREYWEERGKVYLENREPEEEFLQSYMIHSLHLPENRTGIPESVLEANDFYNQHCGNWGGAAVYELNVEGKPTYIVRVSTDGDDGWVEVFNEEGHLLGAARTYIELVAWGYVGTIRNYVFNGKFPDELKDRQIRTLWAQVGEQRAKTLNLIRIVVDLRERESERFLKIFHRVKQRHRFIQESDLLKELAGLCERRLVIDSDLDD